MAKSMLKEIRHVAKVVAKATLYITGGIALGLPLIEGAKTLASGGTPTMAANTIVRNGIGYDTSTHTFSSTQFTNAAMRTGYGALAIYVAGKL